MEKVNPIDFLGGVVTLETVPADMLEINEPSLPILCSLNYFENGIMHVQSLRTGNAYKVHYKHIKEFKDGIRG
jgi:hypothetical protein